MVDLQPWLRVTLAALLVVSIVAAYAGRPPRRGAPAWLSLGVGVLGLACYGACAALLLGGRDSAAVVVVAAAVELSSVAVWLARAVGGQDADEDGGAPVPEPPPFDWDEAERALRRTDRPREPAGVA